MMCEEQWICLLFVYPLFHSFTRVSSTQCLGLEEELLTVLPAGKKSRHQRLRELTLALTPTCVCICCFPPVCDDTFGLRKKMDEHSSFEVYCACVFPYSLHLAILKRGLWLNPVN
jgi:hypothetical protein